MFSLGSGVYDVKEASGSIPVKSYRGRWREEIERNLTLLSYIWNCGFYPINEVFKAEQVTEYFFNINSEVHKIHMKYAESRKKKKSTRNWKAQTWSKHILQEPLLFIILSQLSFRNGEGSEGNRDREMSKILQMGLWRHSPQMSTQRTEDFT